LQVATSFLVFSMPVVEFAAAQERAGRGGCDGCNFEVDTEDGDVLGIASFGIEMCFAEE
jgi:hypothetical protein